MRLPLIIASGAVFVGLLVAARPTPPREILFQVTSLPDGRPLEFEAHALGPDLRRIMNVERAVTPYTLRIPGDEAYVLFRQHGSAGLLHVRVNPSQDRGTGVVSPISMVVVRGGRSGAAMTGPYGMPSVR
jgi:hypothetical protein